MKNLKNHLVVITSLALLILNACSKDDELITDDPGVPIITEFGEAIGQAEEVTIGPDGGTINSSDGLLSVNIPQGALSGSTVISIQAITNQAPLGLGNGYRLGPEGLSFENPVTLTFHYNEELLDSNPAEFLWIVFQEGDGSWKAMLKSALHSDAKTVTVETSHFSDWSLGRFVDLSLNPIEKAVKKGEKVGLAVTGFSKGATKVDDELAPLIDSDENRLDLLSTDITKWRVVEWTLNGVKSPVSNNFGNLQSTENTASYTAPSNVPTPNVVSVSVELETTHGSGKTSTFYLTSNITILDSDLYLSFEFRGQTYIYYQIGFGGTVIEDPNNYSICMCFLTENKLSIGGSTFVNYEITDAFEIQLDNPSKGSHGLIGIGDGGNDDLDFLITEPYASYDMTEETRTRFDDRCIKETNESNHVTMNLTNYSGTSLSGVDGSFTGTLYYSDETYDPDCKSSTPYPISGNFHLLLLTQ
jgi:hypothetical protein